MSNRQKTEIRSYLEEQAEIITGRGQGLLCIVAARAKVSEGELHEIVAGKNISDDIAAAISALMEKDE